MQGLIPSNRQASQLILEQQHQQQEQEEQQGQEEKNNEQQQQQQQDEDEDHENTKDSEADAETRYHKLQDEFETLASENEALQKEINQLKKFK